MKLVYYPIITPYSGGKGRVLTGRGVQADNPVNTKRLKDDLDAAWQHTLIKYPKHDAVMGLFEVDVEKGTRRLVREVSSLTAEMAILTLK